AVVEQQMMLLARTDDALIVLAVAVDNRRLRRAAPESADHDGKAHVLAFEYDQHLLADLGQEIGALLSAGHRYGDAHPVAFVRVRIPGKAQLDAAESLGVAILCDDRDGAALDIAAGFQRGLAGRQLEYAHSVISFTLKRVR